MAHWLATLLVLGLIAGGLSPAFSGAARASMVPGHASAGIVLLALTLLWLVVRSRAPKLPVRGSPGMQRWQKPAHRALFALILLQCALGLLMAASQPYGVRIMNGPDLAALLPASPALVDAIRPLHRLTALALGLLATGHALAALRHIGKDDALKRMLPFADLYDRTVGAGRYPDWRFPSKHYRIWPRGRLS